jgi:hypothetical protein
MTRVAVFVDYQNVYMRAREAFGEPRVDPPRLGVPGRRVWCHHLGRDDFDGVRDDTDYTEPVDDA